VVLSTGRARFAASATYQEGTRNDTGGLNATVATADAEFAAALTSIGMSSYTNNIYDVATLAFDIESSKAGVLQWRYVFGSTEYVFLTGSPPTSGYIDAFVMSVKAPGDTIGSILTKVPGTSTPVAISTVNWASNSNSYIDNGGMSDSAGTLAISTKGLTTLFTTLPYEVAANVRYRIKLVVADVGDRVYDTMVWIKAGSLQIACELHSGIYHSMHTPQE
jgi:hypothetical protein